MSAKATLWIVSKGEVKATICILIFRTHAPVQPVHAKLVPGPPYRLWSTPTRKRQNAEIPWTSPLQFLYLLMRCLSAGVKAGGCKPKPRRRGTETVCILIFVSPKKTMDTSLYIYIHTLRISYEFKRQGISIIWMDVCCLLIRHLLAYCFHGKRK